MKEQYRVTYNSDRGGAFVAHIPGSENLYFHCYSNGLHLIECNHQQFSFVQTIAGNMEGCSAMQINDARRALKLLQILGHPFKQEILGCSEDVNVIIMI